MSNPGISFESIIGNGQSSLIKIDFDIKSNENTLTRFILGSVMNNEG